MKVLKQMIRAEVCTFEELTEPERGVVAACLKVRRNAQAPYSNYHVGAALMTQRGALYAGCNVERASYTQTTHAEQNAIDTMVAAGGPQKLVCMAIVGGPKHEQNFCAKPSSKAQVRWEDICPSCGHCLQIIWENCMGDPDVVLLHVFLGGYIVRTTIGDAFPMRFGPSELGIKL